MVGSRTSSGSSSCYLILWRREWKINEEREEERLNFYHHHHLSVEWPTYGICPFFFCSIPAIQKGIVFFVLRNWLVGNRSMDFEKRSQLNNNWESSSKRVKTANCSLLLSLNLRCLKGFAIKCEESLALNNKIKGSSTKDLYHEKVYWRRIEESLWGKVHPYFCRRTQTNNIKIYCQKHSEPKYMKALVPKESEDARL